MELDAFDVSYCELKLFVKLHEVLYYHISELNRIRMVTLTAFRFDNFDMFIFLNFLTFFSPCTAKFSHVMGEGPHCIIKLYQMLQSFVCF